MWQVTPLFKKRDEFKKDNYRPVTVLPVFNNIYERLLVAQLRDFYQAILSDFISSYRTFYSCETALLKLTEDWRTIIIIIIIIIIKACTALIQTVLSALQFIHSIKKIIKHKYT